MSDLREFQGTFESFVEQALAETCASKQVRDGDALILVRVGALENPRIVQREGLGELDALFISLQHRAFRGEM